MTYTELEHRVNKLSTRRVVTEQMGSWKWQNAYRVATYKAHLAQNGRVLWVSVSHSPKYSRPQLKRKGWDSIDSGSLHNVGVKREEAVKVLGISFIWSLESRGWSFIFR
ncbi:MAG: hypothetical protein WC390_08740 [Sulfurimonas sp.]